MSFLGTPDTIYHKQPDTNPAKKAEPVATEKTLHGVRAGISLINSDLTSITHKLGEKGLIYQVLEEIADILNRSSIARHSESHLEQSLNAIKEQTVYYNEKTMKWHDWHTNKFAPKQKELDTAAMQIRKGDSAEDRMEAKAEITPEDNYLKQIAENTKALLEKDFGGGGESAEDRMESEAWAENRARDTKAYRKTIKGRWDTFLKWGKDSFLGRNWKLILAAFALLFTPFKVLKPLWELVKSAWNFTKEHPIVAAVLGIGTAIALALLGPLALLLAPLKLLRGISRFFTKPKVPRTTPLTRTTSTQRTPAQQAARNAEATRLKGMTKAERHAERASKKAQERAAKKTTETAGKKVAETAAKKTAAKTVAKGLGKAALRKLPFGAGLLFGTAFAVQRAMAGDWTGAGMEIASGAMAVVPGPGTVGSIAMDATIMARDMGAGPFKEKEGEELGKTLEEEYKEGQKEGKKAKVLTKDAKKQAEIEKKKTKATAIPKSTKKKEGDFSPAVMRSQQNKPDDMNSYKGEKGVWSLVGNDWIFYSDRQEDDVDTSDITTKATTTKDTKKKWDWKDPFGWSKSDP